MTELIVLHIVREGLTPEGVSYRIEAAGTRLCADRDLVDEVDYVLGGSAGRENGGDAGLF